MAKMPFSTLENAIFRFLKCHAHLRTLAHTAPAKSRIFAA
jgi:hypothetical protein